jgi:DNA-binding response OmpR family regulator
MTESSPGRSPRVILFVGSQRSLASLVSNVLSKEGYTVVNAASRKEALELSKEIAEVHLLIKDVSSHTAGAADLASEVCAAHPEAKVLFLMSAGEEGPLRGKLGEKVHFLAKPLALSDLIARVSELLMS